MRAVRFREYRGLDGISCDEISEPVAGRGEILVRVHAAGVNPFDWYAAEGLVNDYVRFNLPAVMGRDLSGVVVGLGAGVDAYALGDAVYGHVDAAANGSFADYVVVPASRVVHKPSALAHVEAAALPNVLMAAWDGLFSPDGGADLQPGQTILIHGAAGGIGSVAVQLAKYRGARVFGTASAHNHAFLKMLGVDRMFDYAADGWAGGVEPLDAVLDTSSGAAAGLLCGLLRRGGRYVTMRGLPPAGFVAEQEAMGKTCLAASGPASAGKFGEMTRLVGLGVVKPVVTAVYALPEFRAALEAVRRGHVRGKIVMQIRR